MMAKLFNQKTKYHQALCDFVLYSERQIPILFDNALLLRKHVPQDIENPVLLFLLPRAIDGVLERLILEIEQAWRILNRTLKELKEPPLDKNDKDYKDLDTMRDKLIGHYIEVSLATDKYRKWYQQSYGSYEKTFELIKRIANKIRKKIEELIEKGKVIDRTAQTKMSKQIKVEDINKLLEVLKTSGIY